MIPLGDRGMRFGIEYKNLMCRKPKILNGNANDLKKLQQAITEYMDKSISFYDARAEGFYHGLVLGLLTLMA